MKTLAFNCAARERNAASALALGACVLTLLCTPAALGDVGQASANQTSQPGGGTALGVSATLEQCLPASTDAERSATFAGEMTTVAGAVRMEMRIDVQERMPGEVAFHDIAGPGLGAWRSSAIGVKSYKFLRQITNLSAPATYRGAVRFRWLNARGRLVKVTERTTPICEQPATLEGEAAPPSTGSSSPSTTSG